MEVIKSHSFVFVTGDKSFTFTQVVTEVMRQLEGAYALIFKSPHYPNELVACKRGSTLILGVKVSKAIARLFYVINTTLAFHMISGPSPMILLYSSIFFSGT